MIINASINVFFPDRANFYYFLINFAARCCTTCCAAAFFYVFSQSRRKMSLFVCANVDHRGGRRHARDLSLIRDRERREPPHEICISLAAAACHRTSWAARRGARAAHIMTRILCEKGRCDALDSPGDTHQDNFSSRLAPFTCARHDSLRGEPRDKMCAEALPRRLSFNVTSETYKILHRMRA